MSKVFSGEKSLSMNLFGIHEAFSGPFSGNAFLLFPEDRSLELVRLTLQDQFDCNALTEVKEEALVEVGNIIINSCLSSIGEIFETEIVNQSPALVNGDQYLPSDVRRHLRNIGDAVAPDKEESDERTT